MFFLNLNVTSRNCFLWAFLNKFDTAVSVYVLWNLSDSVEWFKWQNRIRERFECGEIEWKRGNTRKSLFPPHNRLQFYNAWSGSYLNHAQWKIWLLFFCKTRYPHKFGHVRLWKTCETMQIFCTCSWWLCDWWENNWNNQPKLMITIFWPSSTVRLWVFRPMYWRWWKKVFSLRLSYIISLHV